MLCLFCANELRAHCPIFVTEYAAGIKCFNCDSFKDDGCFDDPPDTYLVTCDIRYTGCKVRKMYDVFPIVQSSFITAYLLLKRYTFY